MTLRRLRDAGVLAAAAAVAAALCVVAEAPAASAGAVVETITVGSAPLGVSSDGTHVWVANYDSDTVTELDASTGAVVQTITVGSEPVRRLLRRHPRLGHERPAATRSRSWTPPPARSSRPSPWAAIPAAVSSDGTHVWVANSDGNTVTELDASTGAVVQTITVGSSPGSVSSDGTDVWVANTDGDTVTELDAATGAVVQTITGLQRAQRRLL